MYPLGISQPYGLSDMGGNVWEWTHSWYDDSESNRVLRGGSWDYFHDYAPVGVRSQFQPDDSHFGLGFRLCAPIGSGF